MSDARKGSIHVGEFVRNCLRITSLIIGRLSRNTLFIVIAGVASIIGLLITIIQIRQPSSAQYFNSIEWEPASINYVLSDNFITAVREVKEGGYQIADFRFGDTDDPLDLFWQKCAIAINQQDYDVVDRCHTVTKKLVISIKGKVNNHESQEVLLFYLFQRVKRLESGHLNSKSDTLLFGYMEALAVFADAAGEIGSRYITSEAVIELYRIASHTKENKPTQVKVHFGYQYAAAGYLKAGLAFPNDKVVVKWRELLKEYESMILANHEELWPEARNVFDMRDEIEREFIINKVDPEVMKNEMQDAGAFAIKCQEKGIMFPTSWARARWSNLTKDLHSAHYEGAIMEIMNAILQMAVLNSKVYGGAQETADVMTELCKLLGPQRCSEQINSFKKGLNKKQLESFDYFETKFFRQQGTYRLPQFP